jgi:hypothetical protein
MILSETENNKELGRLKHDMTVGRVKHDMTVVSQQGSIIN